MFGGFATHSLFLIAGPCVLESDELNLLVAETLARIAPSVPGGIIYKASFDKANRSTVEGARGPGLEKGLEALARVREATGLPILTDVHHPEQCAPAAEVVDVLQIPAFLCRQTDLLFAAGATGKPVNVKKGQWMQPEAMAGAVRKVLRGRRTAEQFAPRTPVGNKSIATKTFALSSDLGARTSTASPRHSICPTAVTERGTFFGYGDLVVDMRSFVRLREATHSCIIFDATHSVQRPGHGPGGSSGGAREFIAPLASAAVAAGADAIFLETHPDPEHAPSDGPNMIPLGELGEIVRRLVDVWEATRK
jgi:2-dehydro-3-deoxyphosphooctonate aldolase (KDO 8-P synthase)